MMAPALQLTITVRVHHGRKTRSAEFRDVPVAESRDLDENAVVDVDETGSICPMTVEHASTGAGAPQFSFE
ncbi:MAG: DUF2283 domain-containing protein [Gemmatimonadaceae bacterium]